MFSRVLFVMSVLTAFTPWTFAQNTSTPALPGLTYLYTLNCTLLPPYVIGAGPRGFRVAIPITGGYFNGPRLSGECIYFYKKALRCPQTTLHTELGTWCVLILRIGNVSDLGADWGTTDNSTGVFSADTRYNLVTNDGANIFIQTSGPQQPDGHLHLRQIFETGHPNYTWLNNIVSVGILTADTNGGWVNIDAWQLETPAASTSDSLTARILE